MKIGNVVVNNVAGMNKEQILKAAYNMLSMEPRVSDSGSAIDVAAMQGAENFQLYCCSLLERHRWFFLERLRYKQGLNENIAENKETEIYPDAYRNMDGWPHRGVDTSVIDYGDLTAPSIEREVHLYPVYFVNLLIIYIASEMAIFLTNNGQLRNTLANKFIYEFDLAKVTDANTFAPFQKWRRAYNTGRGWYARR